MAEASRGYRSRGIRFTCRGSSRADPLAPFRLFQTTMRHFGISLVLIALLAPSCCSAWSISQYFGSEDANVYLHPASPKEADPETIRVKRQAYQVHVGGDASVSVDKTGPAESGPWGAWTKDRECSRTCGGGVLIEKRQCSGQCTGPSVRYLSCNIEACEAGSKDFRAEQCAEHNDSPLDGNYHKWLPYVGKNKCELTCKPETANFYYKWADKVVDGTKCDQTSDDICVEGVCLPLGCDGKLGSSQKSDKCGVCGGDGSTCKTVEGIFDERDLTPGYHNIINLPVGATAVKIEELRPTSNSLALKNSSDAFFLNGNYQIEVLDKDVEVAGTRFQYSKQKDGATERITAKGPLEEEVIVALLFQRAGGSKDSAIKYEFSVPLEQDVPYLYKPGEWSSCSVTCGKGVQTRTPFCIDTATQGRVEDALCDEANSTKPEVEKPCETVDCEAEWFEGDWEECSQTCGDLGTQYRVVYCHKVYKDGRRMTVDDDNCTATRPEVQQSCNRFSCPEWSAGPWSACSEKCGDAKQYRSVTCRSEKAGEEGKLLPADSCNATLKVDTERGCNLGPCEGLNFVTSDWKLCEKCNDTEETRNVTCKDKTNRVYPLEKCLNDNTTEIPIDVRSCATVQPCNYEWHTSEWSKCSTECGHGHKTRRVNCAIAELGQIKVVDEALCQGEKPDTKTNCTNEEQCTGTYYTGPWSDCTEKCNGGTQKRIIVCLNYDKEPVPEWCDEAEKPSEEQECNVDPCPTCFDSDFGCCPDNSTFATGDWFEGCSNCSISDFGCCADNVTEATGPNGLGCPEYVEPVEGSGEDDVVLSLSAASPNATDAEDEPETCEVTNEASGDKVSVPCGLNATVDDLDAFLSNETEPENVTIHCSKTEFGCCPDWYTTAEGPAHAGCPEFIQGACNETQYGCCPDNVTLARGPNLEGCGEPSCAASLYGCCKDRKTIAFGTHYAGCERSSFPCELSPHGCCPDGETAALGKNGTGCGANCLVTKFGCCPDGSTVAKGANNEGCGCEFAQYGCCPDGKTAALGVGFQGCPSTCAQSTFGCCPDGKTTARGKNNDGCPCQYTRWGCCPDGETTSLGPNNDGCDNCHYAKYGCCHDGQTKALGPDQAGCPTTTVAPYIVDGTVAPAQILSCAQPQDQGSVCAPGYKLVWFYDPTQGRCSQFWYGGCGGNQNRYETKEKCETICINPPQNGRCYLPKIEGPQHCNNLVARYWYDHTIKQCAAFWWRGCQGNANNFESWEECQTSCNGVGPVPVPAARVAEPPTQEAATPAPQVYQVEPIRPVEVPQYNVPQQPQPAQVHPLIGHAAAGRVAQPQLVHPAQPIAQAQQHQGHAAAPQQQPQAQPHQGLAAAPQQPQAQPHQGLAAAPQQPQGQQHRGLAAAPRPVDPYAAQREAAARAAARTVITELQPSCRLTVDAGPCNDFTDAYYFDAFSNKCHRFIYSGCGGNANRYSTRDECEASCTVRRRALPPARGYAPRVPTRHNVSAGSKSREVCNLRKDNGHCGGSFDAYYYEVSTGTCSQFKYTGCGGNQNRFHSKEECENVCVRPLSVPQAGPAAPVASSDSPCDQPKDTGPCRSHTTKWYYKKEDGTCLRFYYGGCQGNENRFETEQECRQKCGDHIEACQLPAAPGPCSGQNDRFFFNKATHKCEAFKFGGCMGNNNNFRSIEECEQTCGAPSSDAAPTKLGFLHAPPTSDSHYNYAERKVANVSVIRSRCEYQAAYGDCRSRIPMHFFDQTSKKCVEFIYSGCGGNDNKFATFDECDETCGSKARHQALTLPAHPDVYRDLKASKTTHNDEYIDAEGREEAAEYEAIEEAEASHPEIPAELLPQESYHPQTRSALPELCSLAEDRGTCFGQHLAWRFDIEARDCVSFMYTGCNHNANYFTSEEGCHRACGRDRNVAVCGLPKELGQCHQRVGRWFYDATSGECTLFFWSGCGGNGNRFHSKAECQHLCHAEAKAVDVRNVCHLERDPGPCLDAVTQWYFDTDVRECRMFTYGGCRGNANRFNSKEECHHSCQPKLEALEIAHVGRCKLPFESGPCDGNDIKWFFDADGVCRTFSWSGCGGNENRFDTQADCLSACHPTGKAESFPIPTHAAIAPIPTVAILLPKIRPLTAGPYLAGSTVTLVCTVANPQDAFDITWFANNAALNNQALPERFTLNPTFTELTITNITFADVGSYACSAGRLGALSPSYDISVKQLPSTQFCLDQGTLQTCILIQKNGLCSNARYGNYCCRTCKKAGYKF
uniref:Papilin n=1 Tax=Panagrellus redivivus TaxID=6233 RepID=A0A7E4W9T4_PANRE